jgi:hypothetical protein
VTIWDFISSRQWQWGLCSVRDVPFGVQRRNVGNYKTSHRRSQYAYSSYVLWAGLSLDDRRLREGVPVGREVLLVATPKPAPWPKLQGHPGRLSPRSRRPVCDAGNSAPSSADTEPKFTFHMKNNRHTAVHPANLNGVQRISLSHPFVSIVLPPFILPFLPFSFLLLSLFSLFETLPFVHFYLKKEKTR